MLNRSAPAARALLRLVLQEGDEGDRRALDALNRYEESWKRVQPALNGHDLQAMGIPRGPRYGEILSRLRAARLDGEIHTREEEVAMVERMSAAA